MSTQKSILKSASIVKMPTSRSYPSYSGLALEQQSFSLNDLEQETFEKIELTTSSSEKANLKKEKSFKDEKDRLIDDRLIQKFDKLNETTDKFNEKIKVMDEQQTRTDKIRMNNKFTVSMKEKFNDKLIENEILLCSDEQIRRRRESRPRIILNRRSDSLSMCGEKAKINLNRNKRLVKDLRTIETKDFKKDSNKEIKIRDSKSSIKNGGLSGSKRINIEELKNLKDLNDLARLEEVKEKRSLASNYFKSKTIKIYQNLISKTKHSKASNANESKRPSKLRLERSRSQEEFSNLKFKRSSRLDDELNHQVGLVNHHIYSREILMSRAKRRTLKVSLLIVLAFFGCWTPYVTIALWHMAFEESAKTVNTFLQELFFLMAVANSCVNGIVVYTIHM